MVFVKKFFWPFRLIGQVEIVSMLKLLHIKKFMNIQDGVRDLYILFPGYTISGWGRGSTCTFNLVLRLRLILLRTSQRLGFLADQTPVAFYGVATPSQTTNAYHSFLIHHVYTYMHMYARSHAHINIYACMKTHAYTYPD